MNDRSRPDGEAAISDLRRRIDEIDAQIQSLISERASVAREVGVAKGFLHSSDFYRPEREAQVLRSVIERNQGPLRDEELVHVFREIMSACLAQEEPLKVAFLGPEGTFTQSAVLKEFGHSVRALPLATITEVFHEVEGGTADFGVVPVENSTEGTVTHTLDMFLSSPLKICGEVELRIQPALDGPDGRIFAISRGFARIPQSLAQCRAWLAQSLPDVETIPLSSNASRLHAAPGTRKVPAAIAGDVAAEVYESQCRHMPISRIIRTIRRAFWS